MIEETEHPLSDVVEAEGTGRDLYDLVASLDARAGHDFAKESFYVRTDPDCSTLCEGCADRRYDVLAAERTSDEVEEMFVIEDDSQMGPTTCAMCHETLQHHICESTCEQEMEHFRAPNLQMKVLHPSDAYSIARLAEYACDLKVDELALMREIRDLALGGLALPDAPANEDELARTAA